jgi:hypothetical protein
MSDLMDQNLDTETDTGESLDEETMGLIQALISEGYTEDEIVDAILAYEDEQGMASEGEPPAEGSPEDLFDDPPEETNDTEKKEPEADKFAKGGFTGAAPKEKKTPPPKVKKDKKDEGYAQGGYVKAPKNRLATLIGSIGRFG